MINKIFIITVTLIILASIGVLAYIISTPQEGEPFTEFYLLGSQGDAADYPEEFTLGEEGRIVVGIINHEQNEIFYRIEVIINEKIYNEIGPIVLTNGQKWEGDINFVPEMVGKNQKLNFLLYQNNELGPSLKLYLWIDVAE